jgi:hypothetical protein
MMLKELSKRHFWASQMSMKRVPPQGYLNFKNGCQNGGSCLQQLMDEEEDFKTDSDGRNR